MKEELINKWKDAFKNEIFLLSHKNRAKNEFSPHTRDVTTVKGDMLRIIKGEQYSVIKHLNLDNTVTMAEITNEEFQELFDLYEKEY